MQNDDEKSILDGTFARKLWDKRIGGVDGVVENSEQRKVSNLQ